MIGYVGDLPCITKQRGLKDVRNCPWYPLTIIQTDIMYQSITKIVKWGWCSAWNTWFQSNKTRSYFHVYILA